MSTFQQKLDRARNSPEVKKLTDKVQAFADDPKTKEQIDKAKRKIAEIRDGGQHRRTGATAAAGDATPPDEPKAPEPEPEPPAQPVSSRARSASATTPSPKPCSHGRPCCRRARGGSAFHEDRRLPEREARYQRTSVMPGRSPPRSARRARRA